MLTSIHPYHQLPLHPIHLPFHPVQPPVPIHDGALAKHLNHVDLLDSRLDKGCVGRMDYWTPSLDVLADIPPDSGKFYRGHVSHIAIPTRELEARSSSSPHRWDG